MKKLSILILGLIVITGFIFTQSITVTSPNGGETLTRGNNFSIAWTSSGVTGNVNLILWKGSANLGQIAQNKPATGSYSWHVGDALVNPSGTTYPDGSDFKVMVKSIDDWTISDESNGNFTISESLELVTTLTATAILPKPDLAINGKIKRTPKHPGMGESFKIQFQIINNGKGKAVASNAELIIKGPKFNKVEEFSMAEFPTQGSHINYAFDYKLDNWGIYKFTLKLDVDNDITESDENNNEKFILVDVNPRADLIVCVDNDRDAMVAIHKKTITSVVKNIGAFQSVPCKLKLYIEGIGTNYYDIPVLKPGETHTVTDKKKWFTAGKKSIRATIDSNNDVKEFKEDNNYVEGYFNAYTAGFKPKYHTTVKVKCSDNTEAGSWDEIK